MAIRTLDPTKTSLATTKLSLAFSKLIVGQTKAVTALTNLVDKYNSGIYDPTKPIGSFLELGPTGTGKTRVAEAFVMGLGGDPTRNLMRVDCAEFQHGHNIARLVGSPPGYLGHRETHPFFTNASVVAARCDKDGKEIMPFTVCLWDEIEKASDELWNLLLGILDKARLTTGTNEVVNEFQKSVHILTSNIGAAEMGEATDNGFGFKLITEETMPDQKKLENIAYSAAKRKFTPEFLNRMDEVIMFKTLTKPEVSEILGMELNNAQDRILLNAKTTFEFNVSPSALKQILKDGYSTKYNARELKRVIEKHIVLPLSRMVSSNQIWQNDVIVVDHHETRGWEYFAAGHTPFRIGAANGAK
jgi:ATP-dependent Clp protease ATP-binding subunit ClpA